MDDTWRKVRGTRLVDGGAAIALAMETIDGRLVVVQVVPEAVTQLVAELMSAKTHAFVTSAIAGEGALEPLRMRQPIAANRMLRTDYEQAGETLIQVETSGGGIFEFLMPLIPKEPADQA